MNWNKMWRMPRCYWQWQWGRHVVRIGQVGNVHMHPLTCRFIILELWLYLTDCCLNLLLYILSPFYMNAVFYFSFCWFLLLPELWTHSRIMAKTKATSSLVCHPSYTLCTKICIRHDNRKQWKHTWKLTYKLTFSIIEQQTSAKFLSFSACDLPLSATACCCLRYHLYYYYHSTLRIVWLSAPAGHPYLSSETDCVRLPNR